MPLSKVAMTSNWTVASEHPLGSLAGHEVLREGGNAADAAVAVAATIAVALHPLGGLGGDFFAFYYEAKSGRVHCINSSGWAPSSLSADLLKSRGEGEVPLFGGASVVVPGFVAGIHALHRKFGAEEFGGLLSQAIRHAELGVPVSNNLSRSISGNYPHLPASAKGVFGHGGEPLGPGSLLKQPSLAKTLKEVAESGPDGFYKGWVAEAIIRELGRQGVEATKEDFDFQPEWVKPLELEYGGATVHEVPPNSMGATTLLMLHLLSGRGLGKLSPASAERVKAMADAAAEAYGRMDEVLGDPRFTPFDFGSFLARPAKAGVPRHREDADTTSFSLVDSEGNVVCAIQSLFHHFGSRVFVEECGILLNNRGAGFKLAGPNKLEPRKRPLHTLSTLMIRRGERVTAISCSGGDWRPQQHAFFATNILDYGMSLEEAIDFPRAIVDGRKTLRVEHGFAPPEGVSYEVAPLPHPGRTGVAQGVEVDGTLKRGVCDVRGDGIPVGA